MGNRAIVKKGGPFIEVSSDGQEPLPAQTYHTLEQPLYYTHLSFEYGNQYRNDTGHKQQVNHERRRLFQYDAHGRFVCQRGWYPRIRGLLQQMGYEVILVDKDPPKPEKTYQANWDNIFQNFQLRPKQDECLAQIDMHDAGLIDAPPAFGKTHVMAMIAKLYPHAKIDIVTKRKDVVGRIHNILTGYVPSVGRIGGGKKERNRRVTVYTADSLHHSDHDADILLADEAHELMTDRLAERLGRYWNSRNYCFTATPDMRLDNAHKRMEGIFGPCIFKMTQQEAEALGLVAHIYVQWLDVDCGGVDPLGSLQQTVAQKRHGIWRNQWRNQAIAEAARSFLSDNLQVLIMVDTVDHAFHLRQLLPEATLCYSEGAVDGAKHAMYVRQGILGEDEFMTPQRRIELRQAFERREIMCAIATGVWSTGVSFDSLNVLIRGDGGDSDTFNVQIPGRVCRTHPESGKEAGILVDFNDKWNSKFQGRSQNRRRAYHKRGWTQIQADGQVWNPGRRRSVRPI
jgi:superfamily II DNA or RNA helicase